MRVLLIGAGAVGQVYGYHFQRGGAEVAFFVRPKYAEETARGFDLYPANRRKWREAPVRFEGFGVHTDLAVAMKERWDAVVLCVSSTALRKGTWLAELGAALGDATLVTLTPGIEDYTICAQHAPEDQIVSGLIGLSSYPGPLEGETLPTPGMVYWVPPLQKMAFSGPEARTKAIVGVLTKGGLKSKRVKDVQITAAFASPVLQKQMVALELSGWTFKTLRKDKALMRLAHRATRESFEVVMAHTGAKTPFGLRLIRPWILRLVTRLMPLVSPLDMERFFEKHFLKVGDQTELAMEGYLTLGDKHGIATPEIAALLERLRAHRGGSMLQDGVIDAQVRATA